MKTIDLHWYLLLLSYATLVHPFPITKLMLVSLRRRSLRLHPRQWEGLWISARLRRSSRAWKARDQEAHAIDQYTARDLDRQLRLVFCAGSSLSRVATLMTGTAETPIGFVEVGK